MPSPDTHPWIVKYRPRKPREIAGQKEPVTKLSSFLRNYRQNKKKGAIIYGPPGTGKTSAAYAIASELNLEVVEVNASDFRNKDKINSVVGQASKQMSLFGGGKLILVDEIDGLSGTKDRGGIQALTSVLQKTSHPMVLTAHNPYDRKFSKLKSRSELISFEPLDYTVIFGKLAEIAKAEGVEYEEMALKSLARRAGGDLRAAVNDLQTISGKTSSLKREDLEVLEDRAQRESIVEALVKIFKTTDARIASQALDSVDEDMDEVILWLDENLPKEYTKPADLARAYGCLSRADVFRRRIRRWQHWRFLVYIRSLITAGVASSKDEKYKTFTSYAPTRRLLKIWMANQRYAKRKSIAEKIAEKTHCSTRVALNSTLPYMQKAFSNKRFAEEFSDYLDLGEDEIGWLKK